jgi:hypothetical protein
MIAAFENDLDEQDRRNLDTFLQKNPALRSEYLFYQLARVESNEEIVFSQKGKLYQKASTTISLPGIYRLVAAAALILISFSLYQFYFKAVGPSGNQRDPEPHALSMEMILAGPLNTYAIPMASLQYRKLPSPIIKLPGPKYEPISSLPVLAFRSELQVSPENREALALQLPYIPTQLIIDDYLYDQQRKYLAIQEPVKERSLFGRIINGLFNKVSDEVEPALTAGEEFRTNNRSFWDLAESGINGFNNLTNNDVILVRTLDEKGKTRKVRLLNNNQ